MSVRVTQEPWLAHPWFVPAEKHSSRKSSYGSRKRARIRTTRNGHSDILPELLELIDSAEHRVFCCSFLLGSKSLQYALIRAASRLKGHVYVLTALDEKKLAAGLGDDIDSDSLHRSKLAFQPLCYNGVYARGVADVHAKFCIVDDQRALLGSPNFDPNGLADHGQQSGEVAIVVDGDRSEHLARLFRHLWTEVAEIEAMPSPVEYQLSDVKMMKTRERIEAPPAGDGMPFWTGFGSTGVLDQVRWTAEQAKDKLCLAAYSIRDLETSDASSLSDAISAAAKRGVDVQLYLRSQARNLEHLTHLVSAGVRVRADRFNHAKWAIADGQLASIFSANFDGIHGLTNGCETGIRLLPGVETAELTALHQECWTQCDVEAWMPESFEGLVRQSNASLGWPDGASSVTLAGEAAFEALEILRNPTFLLEPKSSKEQCILAGTKGAVGLHKEDSVWQCCPLEQPYQHTPARYLATGKPNDAAQLWIPVGVEFVAR